MFSMWVGIQWMPFIVWKLYFSIYIVQVYSPLYGFHTMNPQ